MAGYLLRRLGYYVVLLVMATFLSYLLASAALSPRAYFEGKIPPPQPASVDRQLTALGINDHTPVIVRFGSWAGGVLHGDFGRTIDNTSVNEEFGRRLGVSLRLLLLGTIVGTIAGIAAGAYSALRQYRFSDRAITIISFVLLSTPVFLLAVLLKIGAIAFNQAVGADVILFTGESSAGLTGGFWTHVWDAAIHLLLPTMSIGLMTIALYSRYQRSTMLDVLGADYLRTARAKGLTQRRAVFKHGLRIALIPMSTFFAYGFLGIVTGAIFTEKIFGWNGMGAWFIDAINKSDVNSVVTVSMFTAVSVLLAGLVADVLHAALDPRVRVG
ncbi:ABC transporter permease [Fodinicola acaciae]|uniref:ABC transporter permease n=1 Tax=Fodinicola acaciae TaxID=2681555 RepID=UPI0013D6B8DA|nr:ABC transporter permease [Fodinicola acaciae]